MDPGARTSVTLLARLGGAAPDAPAWGEFLRRYGPQVLGWCRHWRLQEADAEDVAQDVLLRVSKQMKTFHYDPGRSFRGWLKTVSRAARADWLDARRRAAARGSGSRRSTRGKGEPPATKAEGRRHAVVAVFAAFFAALPAAQPPAAPAGIEAFRPYLLTDPAPDPKNGTVRVTFLGATTLLFDDGETKLMTDGFFTRPPLRAVAAGPIATDPQVVDAALEKAGAAKLAALFVAHTHYDHALDSAHVARATGATLYGSASALNVGRGGDVPEDRMVRVEAGKEYAVGRFTVVVLKAKHSPPIRFLNDDLGQTIDRPLKQPARVGDYKEGGAFDFLVKHGKNAILVNAGGDFVAGARDGVRADVVFLCTPPLGVQPAAFQNAFYDQTVGKVRPALVVPVHWDNFMTPLSDRLDGMGDLSAAWDVLVRRLRADGIRFGVLQGYGRVTLFGPASRAP